MFQNSGSQSGPAKGIRLSFLTQADQAKFEQLFAQSAAPYGGSKIPAQTVSELLRRSNLDNNSLAKIWDLASIANAPHLTFPEFAVAMFLTSKQLTGQALPASLPPNIREETEIAMATIESTETSQQLVNTNTPQYMNPPMMAGMQSTGMQPQVAGIRLTGMQPTGMQPQMTSMQPQMTGMPSQLPIMTGMQRPTPPPIPQLPMQTGYTSQFQAPMQTGFQPSQPSTKPRLQNLDFAKKMMPNQNGVTNLLNPSLGTKDSERISWKISPEEKQRYREIFDAWDGTGTGFMSGETAKDVLTQSQLPPEDLMKIWNLADHDNKGSLDHDEFAIAMHLVYRKMNGFEIPSVLPPELRPPSSLLKKFVIGRRPPPSTPSFGSPQHQPSREETEDYSLYNSNQHDYVSSSRRKGPQSFVSRSYASYNNDDDEEDVRVLEDLRRQISETKRQLDRMPKITTTSAYSASNKYSLEELKEKIRRAHEDLHYATKSNPLSSKYFENKETLLGLLETQKSLQDEIQYLCNRDIPVLARQLRGSAAELRDAKVRNSRKTDSSQDFMAFIQPTGPGGSITESDRVRAKAKAMMAARKAGQTGSSSDASFVLRRAEEEKEEMDRKADNVEREMEKSRTALLDMRGDLRYLEEMPASKDLQDKKRFENGQELAYELRRFIEQLDSKISEPSSYSPHTSSNFRSTSSLGGYQSPSYVASPTLSSVAASPKPKPAPARPRTAEEIKKEAERRVQERLAAIQAKRNPGSSPRSSASATPATPVHNKLNEAENVDQHAEREAQEMLRASVSQLEEADRKKREVDLERLRESENLERQRLEDLQREEERARKQREEEDEKRREQEDREFEERKRLRLAKEEADRQARFDAIRRHEEEEEAKKAQKTEHKPEEVPSTEPAPSVSSPAPPPPPPPAVTSPAVLSESPAPTTDVSAATTSSNNPFAKLQQSNAVSPVGSSQAEKPNEPTTTTNKRISYNPFATFSAFSATKGNALDDSDSDDDGWDVGHDDSEDENEFPAAGSAKNLAGMLFDAMSKRGDSDVSRQVSPKPDAVEPASSDVPSPPPPPPAVEGGIPPPPPPPAAPAVAAAAAAPTSTDFTPPTGGNMRNALLGQIQAGTKLKKTETNDRSASAIAGHVIGDASAPVQTASQTPVVAPEPVAAPLSSGGFLAELQARTDGASPPVESVTPAAAPVTTEHTETTHDESLPEIEYIALWDYPGSGEDDLSFSQDDIILIRDNNETEDWWYGTLQKNNKKGYFPRNYVQLKPEAVPELNIKAKALYDFEGPEGQGCLDFKMGETVIILVKENDDWWKAKSEDGTRVGLVPANYLEEHV